MHRDNLLPPACAWGLWEVWNIKMKYLSEGWFQLRCQHHVVNGETEVRNVYYTPLDRILGIDFDRKVLRETRKFIAKMESRNERILRLKAKGEALSHVIKSR
ncbi:hypothetical protein PA598K_01359 [Paenibacillus sp. 598K]|uniref:hypothetical protein n=1 Tax=Paenibacillus sp. 598K TaxID=1117987 RepID=UPI000FF96CF4|nr:hypothetical protein [Paenibacillus sp. 598K]GBF73074.1 hypothetical protein PA598K_01359 [Paenibacillus sp. 598K]